MHRHYSLLLLALVYGVNYLDRQILAILLQPIKQEFHLSDSALGLLAGPAFALFYATLGVPIALLADRVNRRNIIAASLVLFGLATFLCGWVTQFWQLLLARIVTGIGEAGTGPAAQAVISDLYAPKKRATAQSFYAVGLNVGLMAAFLAGGWITQHYGWRNAFLAAGIPAIVLAAVVLAALREPARGAADKRADTGHAPSGKAALGFLWGQRSYRYIVFGTAMSAFSGYGITAFLPAFLIRSHHLTTAEIGFVFALILGIGGGIGTFLSGAIADRLGARNVRWNLYVPALAAFAALPFWPVFFLSPNTNIAILAAIVPCSLGAAFVGPCQAMIQGLSPLRMRATAAAFQLLIGNIIGLGLGPQIIGVVSDLLLPIAGNDALRYALFVGVIAAVISAWSYWRAARTLQADIAKAARADAVS